LLTPSQTRAGSLLRRVVPAGIAPTIADRQRSVARGATRVPRAVAGAIGDGGKAVRAQPDRNRPNLVRRGLRVRGFSVDLAADQFALGRTVVRRDHDRARAHVHAHVHPEVGARIGLAPHARIHLDADARIHSFALRLRTRCDQDRRDQ